MLLTFEPGDTEVGKRAAPDRARPGHRRARPTAPRCCSTPRTRPSTSTRSCCRRWSGARSSSPTATSTPRSPTRAPAAPSTSPRSSRSPAGPPHDLRPHLTVVLDLEPAAGLGRFDGPRPDRGRVAGVPPAGARGLRRDGAADPDHYLVLDARQPVDEIAVAVRDRVAPLLAPGGAMRDLTVWDDLVGQQRVVEALRSRRRRPRDDPRLAVHRATRVGPLQRRGRVRRRARSASRAAAGTATPAAPCWPARTPTSGDPHREALDRRRRGPRPGPPRRPRARRATLAGPDRRGRRPAHRPGLQRAAQGDRGAHRPDRVDALRPHRRGRAAHDPLALPAGHADHPDAGGRRRVPGPQGRRRRRARVVRRPRQPGPHRPRAGAGPRRGHPQPAARGGLAARPG